MSYHCYVASRRSEKEVRRGDAEVDERKVAYLDRSGKEVTIMRQPCSKRRPVVKGVYRSTFGELEARLERVNFAPKFQYFLFLLWEVKR